MKLMLKQRFRYEDTAFRLIVAAKTSENDKACCLAQMIWPALTASTRTEDLWHHYFQGEPEAPLKDLPSKCQAGG